MSRYSILGNLGQELQQASPRLRYSEDHSLFTLQPHRLQSLAYSADGCDNKN